MPGTAPAAKPAMNGTHAGTCGMEAMPPPAFPPAERMAALRFLRADRADFNVTQKGPPVQFSGDSGSRTAGAAAQRKQRAAAALRGEADAGMPGVRQAPRKQRPAVQPAPERTPGSAQAREACRKRFAARRTGGVGKADGTDPAPAAVRAFPCIT